MAPKRPSTVEEDQQAASSSSGDEESEEEGSEEEVAPEGEEEEGEEEEEEGSDEEEEEEDDDDEGEKGKTSEDKKSSVKKADGKPETAPSPGQQPKSTSDDEEEDDGSSDSESGSESDLSPGKPLRLTRTVDPNIKPISSRPMDESSISKKPPTAKPAASPVVSPIKSAASVKRPAQTETDEKESRKRKKKVVDGYEEETVTEEADKKSGEDSKKLFQRLWSDDDEIAILKGMHDYSKKGKDPTSDMSGFLDFIKKSLHVEVNRNQLADKVRRLKKKYQNNANKKTEPAFSKPHEQKSFELSKKVWGVEANDVLSDKATANGKKGRSQKNSNSVASPSPKSKSLTSSEIPVMPLKSETEVDEPPYPYLRESLFPKNMNIGQPVLGESIFKQGLDLIGSSKAKELDEKWRKWQHELLELHMKRADLVREQTKLILDAVNSANS